MIAELVDGLPEAQRVCTYLFYYDQMSVKEIAELVGVSENTIKSRLNYARKAIKEGVQDYEKQGVKLYSLSPLPFLLYFLRGAAESSADRAAAEVMVKAVLSAEGAAAAAGTAGAAAVGTAQASGTAGGAMESAALSAGGAGHAAGSGAAKVGAGLLKGAAVKVTAGVLDGSLAVGGIGWGLSRRNAVPAPELTPADATQTVVTAPPAVETAVPTPGGIASYTVVRTTVDTQEYPAEIYLETPQFEETSEGYRVLNEIFEDLRSRFLNGEDHNVAYLLGHLDNRPNEGPLCYIETYEVEAQDETSVTIKISYQYDFGYMKDQGSGSGSCTFDTLTGKPTGPMFTEEGIAAVQAWIEEQKETYASGGYEYGDNFFAFCRPEFGSFGGGHGSPRH